MYSYPPTIRTQARHFRSQGLTYREIGQKIHVRIPKSTLSSWFKDISMPPTYFRKIHELGKECIFQAQKINKQNYVKRMTALRQKNHGLIASIDKSVGKLILATLYWCEGAKYPSHRNIRFGSSDPKMIHAFLSLLRWCYQIDETKLRQTIQCRADQNTKTLTDFWSKLTKIPTTQQYQARVDARSIGKPTIKNEYRGVCVVEYFSADLLCELQFTGEMLGSPEVMNQVKNNRI